MFDGIKKRSINYKNDLSNNSGYSIGEKQYKYDYYSSLNKIVVYSDNVEFNINGEISKKNYLSDENLYSILHRFLSVSYMHGNLSGFFDIYIEENGKHFKTSSLISDIGYSKVKTILVCKNIKTAGFVENELLRFFGFYHSINDDNVMKLVMKR